MLPTPVEIKEKLLKALDDKNDVDDAAVVEMVSVLEKYPITRATLEETKIGKMVNDLRRKIKNEKLAKRVKQLVRNWKKILDQTAPVNGSPGLVHPAIAQLQSSPAVSPALSQSTGASRLVSPAQVRSKPNTPTMGAQRGASPALTGNKGAQRSASPALAGNKGAQRSASPALAGNKGAQRSASPALAGNKGAQRNASPALAGNKGAQRNASPALAGNKGAQRNASHALAGNKGAQRSASPALAGNKPGAMLGRKGVSPAAGGNRPNTPTAAHTQRLASPALVGRSRPSLPPGRMVSPAVPGKVVSPAVSGRAVSPLVTGCVVSPALGQPSPLAAASPPIQSAVWTTTPVSRRREDNGSASAKRRPKGKAAAAAAENSNCSGRVTPVSVHSENSQDRVLGEGDNGKHDSDNESSSSSTMVGPSHYQHSHSTGVSLTNTNNKNYGKDRRELSKTNVANRKRAREKSNSPPDEAHKKLKLQSSSHSVPSPQLESEKVINGCVPKSSSKKGPPALEFPRVSSTGSLSAASHKTVSSPLFSKTVSSPLLSSAVEEDHPTMSHSQPDNLFRQESTDSRLSAHSLDRPSRDKHKVKTTEQLIEQLQKKNNSANVGKNIMTKLRTNEIEKEKDVPGSSLPPGLKPKGKRGRLGKNRDINLSVPSSDVTLSQVKNELVERFLKTSDPSSPVDEYSPFKDDLLADPAERSLQPKLGLGACSSSYSKDNFDSSFSACRQDRSDSAPKDENSMDASSPPIPSTSQSERTGSALTLQEIYAQLPPINYDIDWDSVDFYDLPEPTPVSDEVVGRMHAERLPEVNGIYDINKEWTSWKETMTLPSYEGNQLHILPYVDLG